MNADARLPRLYAALTEARVNELREADLMLAAKAEYDRRTAAWKDASAGLNAAQKALDDHVRDRSMADARAIVAEARA